MTDETEDQQLERLRQWWKEYWLPLVGGVVLGLGGILGWQQWGDYQAEQAARASSQYNDLVAAVDAGEVQTAAGIQQTLVADYKATPYAALGSLMLAKAQFEAEALDAAAESLRWVVNYADDDAMRAVAGLRLARVHWTAGDVDQALAVLTDTDHPSAFESAYRELEGDIHLAADDRDAARSAYEAALAATDVRDPRAGSGNAGLTRKLAELGEPVTASDAADAPESTS